MAVWLIGLGVAGLVVLLGYVWLRVEVVEAGYRLSATGELLARLEMERRELAVRVAKTDTPEHLQALARGRLRMRRPGLREEVVLP